MSSLQSHILTSACIWTLCDPSLPKNFKLCSTEKKWILHESGLEMYSLNDSAGKASWRKHILTVLDSWYSLDTASLGACRRDSLTLKSSVRWGQTWEKFSATADLRTASAERCPWEETTVHPLSAHLWARHGLRYNCPLSGVVVFYLVMKKLGNLLH